MQPTQIVCAVDAVQSEKGQHIPTFVYESEVRMAQEKITTKNENGLVQEMLEKVLAVLHPIVAVLTLVALGFGSLN